MFSVGLDLSPKQLSKLRNGAKVRVKRGKGCNLIVNPQTYSIVERAFRRNRGAEIALSPEEIEVNMAPSPEEQQALMEQTDLSLASPEGEMTGGALSFKKIKRNLKPFKKVAKEAAKHYAPILAEKGTRAVMEAYGSDEADIDSYSKGANKMTKTGLKIAGFGMGAGLGAGMYSGRGGFRSYDDLNLASMGNLKANKAHAKYTTLPHKMPLRNYWNRAGDPPSRGSGMYAGSNNVNLIRGRGASLNGVGYMPQALQSQAHGANFHFQFMLPPQYQDVERMVGNGIYT